MSLLIWTVLSTVLFYATPVLYPIGVAPERLRHILQLNPLTPDLRAGPEVVIDPDAPGALGRRGGTEWLLAVSFAVFVALCGAAVWNSSGKPRESPRSFERSNPKGASERRPTGARRGDRLLRAAGSRCGAAWIPCAPIPPGIPMKVVIVDNDSNDGAERDGRRRGSPEVDLIASPTNLGFSAATNLGARRGHAPYLLALNPDTEVTEGALDTVLAALEDDPRAAAAGPRLVTEDGSLDHAGETLVPNAAQRFGPLHRGSVAARGHAAS